MAASLLEIGLSNLFVAAVLALAAAAAGRWGTRPAVTHALWLLVLLKLVTPPLFTVPVPLLPAETETAVTSAAPSAPTPAAPEPTAVPAPVAATPHPAPAAEPVSTLMPLKLGETPTAPAPAMAKPPATMPAEPGPLFPVVSREPESAEAGATASAESRGSHPGLTPHTPPGFSAPEGRHGLARGVNPGHINPGLPGLLPALLAVWLGGGAAWLALVFVRVRRFARVLRRADDPTPEFLAEADRVAAGVGLAKTPRVKVLPGAVAPMVWSFGRTTVFFPADLLARLSAEQRASLIAHEFAHVRRRDHLVRWVELAALALYWWCPLVWVARRELQRAEEECCDAWVVASLPRAGRTYAEALLDTLDFLAGATPAPAFASGLGPAGAIKRRLQLVLAGRTPRQLPPGGRLAVAVLALLLLPLAPTLARLAAETVRLGRGGEATAKAFRGMAAAAEAEAAKGAAAEPLLFETRPQPFAADQMAWWQVAVSPDGKTLATAHGDRAAANGEVWLWDVATKTVKHTIREGGGVRAVAFSPDGKTLATGNFDNAVRLYDAATGKLWVQGYAQHGGHTQGVTAVTFFRNGELLASASQDKTVRVWHVAAAAARRHATGVNQFGPVAVIEGHTAGVLGVAATPDGKSLLSCSQDTTARLWDIPAELPTKTDDRVTIRTARKTLRGNGQGVEVASVRADGKLFATGSHDGGVRVWGDDGTLKTTFTGFPGGAMRVAFSPDGTALAAGSGAGGQPGQLVAAPGQTGTPAQVRVWAVNAAGDQFTPAGSHTAHSGVVWGMAWMPDGKTLVTAGAERVLQVWTPKGKADPVAVRPVTNGVPTPDSPVLAGAISPDGKLLAFSTESDGVILWDAEARKPVRALVGHTDVVGGLAFSPDGKHLATASQDKTVKLWDVGTGAEVRTLKGHTNWVFAVAFHPTGKTLATGGYDKTVRLWDAATGELKATWKDHTAGVRAVAFSPDGSRLASAGGDRFVRVWDATKGELLHTLKGHKGAVRSLAFRPDGAVLASGSEDRTVKLWDAAGGTELRSLGDHPDLVTAVRFSASGRTLAAGTFGRGQTVIWDAATGRKRQALATGSDAVTAVLFAGDGESLVTAGADKQIRVWKGVPAPESAPTKAFPGGPAVALSPDGKLAAVGGADGKLAVYDANTGAKRFEAAAHPGGVTRLEWAGTGKFLVSAGADDTVKVWNPPSPAPARTFAGTAAAASPDGKWVAASAKADVVLYDAATGAEVRKLTGGHDGPATHLAFSPDGGTLATLAADRTVRLWNPATGKRRQASSPLKYHETFTGLSFSPDSKKLAIAANTPDEAPDPMEEFQFRRAAFVFTLPEAADEKPWAANWPNPIPHQGRVTAVGWSAGGRGLVTAADDGFVRLFDPADGKSQANSRAHRAAVLAASVQPDAGAVLTAGEDGTVRRWPLPGAAAFGTLVVKLPTPGRPIWAAEFSPDGRVLATAGAERVLRLYDPAPAPRANLVTDQAGLFAVAYTPDGKSLVSGHGDNEIVVWDAATGKPVRKLSGSKHRVWGVAVTPDGKRVVSAGGGDSANGKFAPGEALVWDISGDSPPRPLEGVTGKLWAVALSPDGKQAAGACGDFRVRVWDVESGKLIHTLKGHGAMVRAVAYTPDGAAVVSGAFDSTARVWDAATGAEKRVVTLPDKQSAAGVAVTPDGKHLVIGAKFSGQPPADSTNCNVLVYDLRDANAKPRELKGHAGVALGFAFLDGGQTMVTAGGRDGAFGEVLVWDFATGQVRATFGGHKLKVTGVALSPDGKTLATAGGGAKPGELMLWSTAGLKPAATVADVFPGQYVTSAAFSPDGKTLVLGGWDWSVGVFDVSDPTRPAKRATMKTHKNGVRSVAFSPDGSRFVTSDEAGVVKVWDAKSLTETKSFVASEQAVYRAKFTPDGKQIVTAAGNWKNRGKGEIRVWNPDTGDEVARYPDQSREVWDIGFLDGGKKMVTVQATGGQPGDAAVKVWDTATRKQLRTVPGIDNVRCGSVSPDGRLLAVGAHTGKVKVWDTATWQEVAAVPDFGKAVFRLSFAPDGSRLAVASEDGHAAVVRLPAPPPMPTAKPTPAAAGGE